MRVGIQGWGSEGDLRPLIALAGGLRRSGHEVRLVLTPVDGKDYSGLCRSLDVALRVVPERLDFTLDRVAEDAQSLDPLKVSRELVKRAFDPFVDQLYESARELCASADVLVWHYSCWYAKAAALKSGTPDAAVHFYPGLVPTRERPPGGLPNLGVLNPLLWRAARWMLDQFRQRPAQLFSRHGLPPVRHVLPDALFSERMNLHAFSPQVCPPAGDWGPEHHVTGQFVMTDTAEPWEPSTELAAFLEHGDKPVLVSLGSMEHLAPQRSRELLVGAARAANVRAIVQSKRFASQGADGDVYFLPWAPHDALLRHCSAMVHHGGAGTVHAALRAGVPSLAVPFIFEQKAWGDLLHRTGAGGRPIRFWKAKVDELARGIRELVTSEPLAKRAREVGEEMSREWGVATAASLLEQRLVRTPRRRGDQNIGRPHETAPGTDTPPPRSRPRTRGRGPQEHSRKQRSSNAFGALISIRTVLRFLPRALLVLATLLLVQHGYLYVAYAFTTPPPVPTEGRPPVLLHLASHLEALFHSRPWIFPLHTGAGATALLLMLIQASSRLRKRWPNAHRPAGYLYAASVVVSSIAGIILAPRSLGGPLASIGFVMLGLAWIVTTLVGASSALRQNFAAHRSWMVRSASIALTAVTFRVVVFPILMAAGLTAEQATIGSAWSFVPNLVVAELWLVRRLEHPTGSESVPIVRASESAQTGHIPP